jgi:ABC-type glycerol-3-phosphate transport system substrate-binding protein
MLGSQALSRRDFLKWTAVASSAALLVACQPVATSPGEQAPAGAAPDAEAVALDAWVQETSIFGMQPATDAFLEQHADIQLNLVPTPLRDTATKLLAAIAAGSGAPDLAFVEYGDMIQFTVRGGTGLTDLAPLMEARKDEWVPWSLELVTTGDGKIVGFPVDLGAMALFYRRDTFDAIGLASEPEALAEALATWDDYRVLGEQIATSGQYWMLSHPSEVFEILRQQKGQAYFSEAGDPIINSEPFIEAANYARQIREAGIDAQMDWWTPDWNATLQQGTVGTYASAAWFDIIIHANAPDTGGKWGVVPLPGGASANTGGSYWTIPEMSQKKEAAWTFISFILGTEEGLSAYLEKTKFLPAWEPMYTTPIFTNPDPFYADQVWLQPFTEIVYQVPAIHLDANDPIARELVTQTLARVLDEGVDPQEAFNEANEELASRIA